MKLCKLKACLLPICLILLPIFLSAQTVADLKITANFQGTPLKSALEKIESDYSIRLYFQEEQLPSKTISASFEEASIDVVMSELLSGSDLGYFAYRDFSIIIAPWVTIQEVYSADYYQALEENLNEDDDDREKRKQLVIGDIKELKPSGTAKIKGTVLYKREPVIGATILWTDLGEGTATDENGVFEMELPTGKHEILIQYIGYQDFMKTVVIYSDGEMTVKMRDDAVNLAEVVVEAESADANVDNVQIGVAKLDVEQIKKLPTFMGEADVVKSLLLQPGVSTIGEGATGFNVRGGQVDQNLVMQDESFIFNASHALGFFSTFNTDLIKDVSLYKGNIPAQYGGRIASVLDVELKTGSFQDYKIKGGVGPVSSRISAEGPIVKDKTAFIAGFRSTYSDWVLSQFKLQEVKNSSAFFYDANLRITQKVGEKSTLILSGYASDDEFRYNNQFGFDYSTWIAALNLKTIHNDRLYSKLSLSTSEYKSTQFDFEGIDASALDNSLKYYKIKEHITYNTENGMKIDMGLSSIFYDVNPGDIRPWGEFSETIPSTLENEKGLESAIFANAEWDITPALQVSGGLRFMHYAFVGPKTIFEYENGIPDTEGIVDSISATGFIDNFISLEPRFSARYRINATTSVKLGYSRTSQFINQIANTDSPTPTSQWQLSREHIEPFRSHNFSLGVFKNFKDNIWETSAEVFYRNIDALFDYKDFAILIMNDNLETELLEGQGRAYGFEMSVKKKRGLWHGDLAYTFSRSQRMVEGINRGTWYSSNFDKPHDFSLVLNYQPNQRHTFTMNFSYSTGRPTTPPFGNYKTERGAVVPIYANRNQIRIPDYHRLDIAYTIGQGYKKDQKFKTSWTISVYNVYGRENAFSVFFSQAAFQQAQANQLAILGSAFPALTFNFEFL
jgi:hypothetical protein